MWLFKNLGQENKYLEKIARLPSARAGNLAEEIRKAYLKTKVETPDLVDKVRGPRDKLGRADNIAWEMRLRGK